MGATLFHTGLSPAVTPSTPLNGACHSARPRRDLTGQERRGREGREKSMEGEKNEIQKPLRKRLEQGLGRTCVEDTNAFYTNFNLSPFPLHPLSKPRIRAPERAQEKRIGPVPPHLLLRGYYPRSPFSFAALILLCFIPLCHNTFFGNTLYFPLG